MSARQPALPPEAVAESIEHGGAAAIVIEQP